MVQVGGRGAARKCNVQGLNGVLGENHKKVTTLSLSHQIWECLMVKWIVIPTIQKANHSKWWSDYSKTHPEITRYFITHFQGLAQFGLLEAALMEKAAAIIFFWYGWRRLRFLDLAKKRCSLSVRTSTVDIKVFSRAKEKGEIIRRVVKWFWDCKNQLQSQIKIARY